MIRKNHRTFLWRHCQQRKMVNVLLNVEILQLFTKNFQLMNEINFFLITRANTRSRALKSMPISYRLLKSICIPVLSQSSGCPFSQFPVFRLFLQSNCSLQAFPSTNLQFRAELLHHTIIFFLLNGFSNNELSPIKFRIGVANYFCRRFQICFYYFSNSKLLFIQIFYQMHRNTQHFYEI